MIKKLTINKSFATQKSHEDHYSWAAKVPYLMNNPVIEFSDGLNIIFGPNGCGKSTLTGLCAFLTASEQGGISKVTKKWVLSLVDHLGLLHHAPQLGDLIASIEHDGMPTFYHNPRNTIGLYKGLAFDDDFFDDGLANLKEGNGSVGEVSSRKLRKFFEKLNDNDLPTEIKGDDWLENHSSFKNDYKVAMQLLTASCDPGHRTFIMDEPEMGFSITKQVELWKNISEYTATNKRQVIVATHCPFALNIPGAHYVDMQPGYLDECRAEFKREFGG